MTTQTLSPPRALPVATNFRRKNNIFLEALNHLEHGRIILVTPENEALEFNGRCKGQSAHLHLHDWSVLHDLAAQDEKAFALAYAQGRWDTPDLPSLLTFALLNRPTLKTFLDDKPFHTLWSRFRSLLRVGSRVSATFTEHGSDFYALWLDESMACSSGLFEGDSRRSLAAAQEAKYQRVLRRISASPGEHILEIGCGWGGFALTAARSGIRVTAFTLSQKQADYVRQQAREEGLDPLITVEMKDYRALEGRFNHIVSLGMFEHIGGSFRQEYFRVLRDRLKPQGRALVESATLEAQRGRDESYFLPGGMLPSKSAFQAAALEQGLVCKEMFAFGGDYALTFTLWLKRFDASREKLLALGYDENFQRLWRFHLSACIASFASRHTDVVQVELAHGA